MSEIKFTHLHRQMQLLKLSDTLLQCVDKGSIRMIFARHCYKIFWTIIISDAVKMMNYPIFRQFPFMCFFPNKVMFQYACPIQFADNYIVIPSRSISSTFPTGMIFSLSIICPAFIAHLCIFILFAITRGASIIIKRTPSIIKCIAFSTAQATIWTKFKVTCTSFKRYIAVLTNQISHTLIITHYKESNYIVRNTL